MYDLADLSKWRRLNSAGVEFPNDKPRKVRLELLAAEPTHVGVVAKGLPAFRNGMHIGTIMGYEVISFQIDGPFKLIADTNSAFVWTPELEGVIAHEIPDAITFTTMMNRRERNPQMELMMHKLNQNVERRMRQLEKDVILPLMEDKRLADIERRAARAQRETEQQEAQLVEVEDELGEAESSEADADSGDGLQKRRAVAGRPPLAKRAPAQR